MTQARILGTVASGASVRDGFGQVRPGGMELPLLVLKGPKRNENLHQQKKVSLVINSNCIDGALGPGQSAYSRSTPWFCWPVAQAEIRPRKRAEARIRQAES